jgi:hypothetical protein
VYEAAGAAVIAIVFPEYSLTGLPLRLAKTRRGLIQLSEDFVALSVSHIGVGRHGHHTLSSKAAPPDEASSQAVTRLSTVTPLNR